jgi:hypothetical protein
VSLPPDVAEAVSTLRPVDLAALQTTAALHTRVERKYVVDWAIFRTLVEGLADTHEVLEIDGRRALSYETVYFDSPDLLSYRQHVGERRRRYKARSRRYVDSGLALFEVKLKGNRGQTVKHQLPSSPEEHGRMSSAAHAFLAERVADAYPRMDVPEMAPTLLTNYRRMTLARPKERLTCDFDLSFSADGSELAALDPGYVILESKCERGLGEADRRLRRAGVRPVSISKYCVGVGLLRDDVKAHQLRRVLDRYFSRVEALHA